MVNTAKSIYNSTILLTTNQLQEAEALAERVAIMIRGGLHYIGLEQKLRKRHCKGFQVYLKMKPERTSNMNHVIQQRARMAQTFPGIQVLHMHKYYMLYYLPSEIISPDGQGKRPIKWSTVFH